MFGILLMAMGTALEEAATSIGKLQMRKRLETPWSYGVLTCTVALAMFIMTAFLRADAQRFSPESLPLVALRAVLEIVQAVSTIYAIKLASRSTFGFLRTLTIPFLLAVDMFFAYQVGSVQVIGIGLIVCALLFLYINHGFSKRGSWLVLISALNAVITTSLYKYNITHYNSPEVDQIMILSVLVVFFIFAAKRFDRANPFRLFKHPACLAQAGLLGAGVTVSALSFLFVAPSVLVAVKRTVAVLMSVLSGRTVFAEKKFAVKLISFAMCAVGLILLAI